MGYIGSGGQQQPLPLLAHVNAGQLRRVFMRIMLLIAVAITATVEL